MRALLAASIVIFVVTALAPASAKDVVLTMTPAEATALLNKYGELPWKDANPLMVKLIGQINDQIKPDGLGAAAPLPPKVGDDRPTVKVPPPE